MEEVAWIFENDRHRNSAPTTWSWAWMGGFLGHRPRLSSPRRRLLPFLLLLGGGRCRSQREAGAQDGHHRRQCEEGDDVAAVGLVVVAAAVPQLVSDPFFIEEV